MRSTVAMRLSQAISFLCAALLCCTLLPTTALASQGSLSLIPEGEQGAARIPSGAEGGASEAISHYAADGAPSVDAGGAVSHSENVDDTEQGYGVEDVSRINEDVPLAAATRSFVEADLMGDEEGAGEEDAAEQGEVSELSLEASSAYAAVQHRIHFEANGGSYVPYNVYRAAAGELMPDISGELGYSSGKPAPPSKAGCVFTGFYDGSDYARAKKYYNASFKVDATCDGRTYPADAEGLTLYAGFAPVLNVSVPLRVSIAIGTVDELGEPTVASAEIVNATTAWPVAFTALEWEADDSSAVSTEGMVAASETVNSLLANKVELSPSTMEEMFTDPSSLTLIVSTDKGEVEVPYGKGPVFLPTDEQDNPLYLEAAPSTLPGAAGETHLGVSFAIDKGSSSIARTESVAETRLLSSYEAVTGWEAPASYILFDMQGAKGGQAERLPVRAGGPLPALSETSAPYLNGYDFLGYADEEGTLWYAPDAAGAVVAVADAWTPTSATVLHPVWDTKECTVVFVAGPEGSSATVAGTRVLTASVKYGKTLSTAFPNDKVPDPYWEDAATRIPYRFLGWFSDDGAQAAGDTVIYSHDATTYITARWAGAPVTVTWDTCATKASRIEPTYLESGCALGELAVPTRAGYAFSGWYPRAGGQGAQVSPSTIVYEDTTFYAAWTANKVAVSFVLDDETYAASPQIYDDGTPPALVLPAELPASPEKEDHRFLGWYERHADGSLSSVALDLATAALPATDTVYVGRWAARVAFDAAGGAFASGVASEYYVAVGDTLGSAIPAADSVSREGYAFSGWYSAPQGGFQASAGTLVDAPCTFYARWNAFTYGISYDLAGGQTDPENANPVSYTPDDEIELQAPVRSGYEFTGWSGTGLSGEANLTVTISKGSTGDRAYTAHWKVAPYKISYELAGGTNASGNPTAYGVDSETIVLRAPARTGYDFTGWSGTDLIGEANMSPTIPKGSIGDRSFTAHWSPITYTISFAPDNVNRSQELLHRSSSDPIAYTIESEDFALAVPTSTNYEFAGWSGEGLSGTDTREVIVPKGTTGNKTYTANWTIKTFTVSYNAILADAPENWPQTSERVEYGAGVSITAEMPTRESFAFRGWSEVNNPNSTSAQYLSGQALDSVTRNMELYAVWAWTGSFYLDLTAAQASAINAASGEELLDAKQQRLDAKTIKSHATDISNNSTGSRYYKMYDYIMRNDIKFTSNWQNVTAQNHDNKATSSATYLNSGYDYEVRLIGLDQDYLTANKTGKRAGMTFQFAKQCLTYWYPFNATKTYAGGWKESQLRAAMNSDDSEKTQKATLVSGDESKRSSIWDRAPKTLTDNIQSVYKFTHNEAGNANNTASAISATLDQFFLTSYGETASTNNAHAALYPWIANETVHGGQYQFYTLKGVSGAQTAANEALVKESLGSPAPTPSDNWKIGSFWWMRTPHPITDAYFFGGNATGSIFFAGVATQGSSLAPSFCF